MGELAQSGWDGDEALIRFHLHEVIDTESFIGNEEDGGVSIGAGAVLHLLAFGEPDEMAGAESAVIRDKLTFEDIHAVPAGMGVQWIDYPGRIADKSNLASRFGIGVEHFSKHGPR